MQFSLVGLNHQTAPILIREKAAISAEKLPDSLASLRSYVPQGAIMSTCNRTEVYMISASGDASGDTLLSFLRDRLGIPLPELQKYVYVYHDREAAEHLFRVTGGLESLVVGEFEVLGQVRQSFEAAEKAGMVNLPLRHAFQSAIRTGRRIREETGISRHALSVSSVAVDLAEGIVGNLGNCKMLVIGAGEAGRLVAKVARERGTSQIVIASRTRERARTLAAAFHGTPTDLSHLPDELGTANIVVTCAGAPHSILDVDDVGEAMKARPGVPLVIIDIALPRNVAPEVASLHNVFLYNIDDLTEITNLNRRQREADIHLAEDIIKTEVDGFISWWRMLEVRPVVSALMSKAEKIRSTQLNNTLKKLPPLSSEQRESLEAMTKSIVTRVLKEPVQYLKTNGHGSHAELVKEIFQLDTDTNQ